MINHPSAVFLCRIKYHYDEYMYIWSWVCEHQYSIYMNCLTGWLTFSQNVSFLFSLGVSLDTANDRLVKKARICLGKGLLLNRSQDNNLMTYPKTFNTKRTLVGNEIVDHSDVGTAPPVAAIPTTSSFSTPGFNRLGKDNFKTKRKKHLCGDSVRLILEVCC